MSPTTNAPFFCIGAYVRVTGQMNERKGFVTAKTINNGTTFYTIYDVVDKIDFSISAEHVHPSIILDSSVSRSGINRNADSASPPYTAASEQSAPESSEIFRQLQTAFNESYSVTLSPSAMPQSHPVVSFLSEYSGKAKGWLRLELPAEHRAKGKPLSTHERTLVFSIYTLLTVLSSKNGPFCGWKGNLAHAFGKTVKGLEFITKSYA